MKKKTAHRIGVMIEFFIFGVIIGITEDLIAIKFATDAEITWNVIWIVVLVAIPFAILGELVVDNIDMGKYVEKWFDKKTTRR
jgi:hypothetical protein